MNENIKHLVFGVRVVFVLLGAFAGGASATTWYVEEGDLIQAAVDSASLGDTIVVRGGTYIENVDVDKRLTIRSENGPGKTIVQAANPHDRVFEITADYVKISGFTVEGKAIYLDNVDYCSIANNNCSTDKYAGIELRSSNNNTLTNNTASNSRYGHGIIFYSSSNNTLTDNIVSNNYRGIFLGGANNILINNTASNSYEGIVVWDSGNNTLTGNTANSNEEYGISLYSSNNILTNNIASNNSCGIRLTWADNNTLMNTTALNNDLGICLSQSSNNNTLMNNIASNNEYGIYLSQSSNNTLTNNTASNNNYGIYLWSWNYCNTFTNNTASNNNYGIALHHSSDNNIIYLNNFIDNTDNAYSYKSTNIWNSTSPINYTYNGSKFENYLGNYWDDYEEKYPDAEEIDGTGIWDTLYSINGDKDNYPLVDNFENYFGGRYYSALIKCISSETDFYKKSSETTFDSWWWTEKADEEMGEAMEVLASSLVGSVAGAELQLALLGTGSKIVKVIGPVGYMMTAYDVVNAISKGLDSRFYSDIGWAIAGDSVLIQGDLNNLVANGNNLTKALKDKKQSRIESLLEKRAYLIKVVYEDLATLDKNAATSLKNPSTTPLYVPSDEYQLIHSHVATLHFQLQRDYSVTISTLNNLTGEDYNPFLHGECPEGKIKPQRLDKGVLGWCYGCLDHTGDSDKFNIRVPSESDTLCVVVTYGLHEIPPEDTNITLKLEQDGELIKQSNDKLVIESPEEGTYDLYVESRNGSQVYGFCTHTDLCGGWKILPTDIQPAWEAYPEYPEYPEPIIFDYLTNPIKVDKDKVSTEEEITVSVNASNEGGASAWQSIAISSPDINNTKSYTILESNLDYCEKYGIGYDTGYNYGNTTKPLKYPLIEGAKNNWDKYFTGKVKLKIKPEKEGILRIYAKSVAYGSGVWRSAPKIFETSNKDQQNEYVYVKSIVVTNEEKGPEGE